MMLKKDIFTPVDEFCLNKSAKNRDAKKTFVKRL